jgi:hypothetical protein
MERVGTAAVVRRASATAAVMIGTEMETIPAAHRDGYDVAHRRLRHRRAFVARRHSATAGGFQVVQDGIGVFSGWSGVCYGRGDPREASARSSARNQFSTEFRGRRSTKVTDEGTWCGARCCL